MCDYGEISIFTLRHVLWQFQLQTLLLCIILVHRTYFNYVCAKVDKKAEIAK
jgi:hypothetical protein